MDCFPMHENISRPGLPNVAELRIDVPDSCPLDVPEQLHPVKDAYTPKDETCL